MSGSVLSFAPSSLAPVASAQLSPAPEWWPLVREGADFTHLSAVACWKLLASADTGWLSWPPTDGGPRLPAGYTVTAHDLLLTPAADCIVRAGELVMLQVTRFDPAERSGWSVVVAGRSAAPTGETRRSQTARHISLPLAWAGVVGRTLSSGPRQAT